MTAAYIIVEKEEIRIQMYNPIKMGTNEKACYKIYYNKAKMLFTGTLISNALPS